MPPRKKARVSQATSPTPTSQPKTPTPAQSSPSKTEQQLLDDPWTDEEEIGLFKGLMRWKPTGIHKHFHLMSLHQYLSDGGYIHPRNEHTKPAGIWRKLEILYNLEALDEREDARQLEKVEIPAAFRVKHTDEDGEVSSSADDDADVYSDAANKIDNEDFELPNAEFGQDKWERRLEGGKQRKGSSPMVLAELNMASEPPVRFTPSFSIEPSETATPTSRKGRSGPRGRAAGGAAGSGARRSARQAESVADDDDQDEEDGEDEPDEAEEDDDESAQSTPAPRSTRRTKGARGRSTRGQRGGRRGRYQTVNDERTISGTTMAQDQNNNARELERVIQQPRSSVDSDADITRLIHSYTNYTHADLRNGCRVAQDQNMAANARLRVAMATERDRLDDQIAKLDMEMSIAQLDLRDMQRKTANGMKDSICVLLTRQWAYEKQRRELERRSFDGEA